MSNERKNMASKRQIRRKECGDKRKFNTHDEANSVRHNYYRAKYSVYKCKWCGGFHIGHTPYSVRQMLRARHRMNPT